MRCEVAVTFELEDGDSHRYCYLEPITKEFEEEQVVEAAVERAFHDHPEIEWRQLEVRLTKLERSDGLKLREYIFTRDGAICVYCHDAVGQVLDHVYPHALGGPTSQRNLVVACYSCNVKKAQGKNLERMMAQGFKHLLDVGESLVWIDDMTRAQNDGGPHEP